MTQHFEAFSTQLIQSSGHKEGSVNPAIVNSAAFGYGDPETAESIFNGSAKKPLYARMGNPTTTHLETMLATMDGGIGAVATSSGMGATALVTMSLLQSGDEVICIGGLFGGTYSYFNETMVRFGVTTKFYDTDALDDVVNGMTEKTKMIFCESVGNPNMRLPDVEAIARMSNDAGIALVVDNTTTPLSLQPLALGADIVIYSTTKLIAGNASALGGAAVFRAIGDENDKFRSNKYAFMHRFIDKMGASALIGNAKKRAMRDLGMSPSAFNSYLTILGLHTLPLRMERIMQSTETVAIGLDEAGINVNHPGLKTHPHHHLYQSMFQGCSGSLLTIDAGSKQKAYEVLKALKLFTITANIGDVRSLALHMDSTIYSDFTDEEKMLLGITPGLIRLSIGLEAPDDLIHDLKQAGA